MELKIIPNPDKDTFLLVREKVKENDGYCPCALKKEDNTKCMCKEFREQEVEGLCHCGMFAKVLCENQKKE